MSIRAYVLGLIGVSQAFASPHFHSSSPQMGQLAFKTAPLCATAKNTLAYLNKGSAYDPAVIHAGTIAPIPLERIKATLSFICSHQAQMNDPQFIKSHFDFIQWYPDQQKVKQLAIHKPLLSNLPKDRILMTKYYVHLAKASAKATPERAFALYGLPQDEVQLSLEEANAKPNLIRFQYGKQAILKGVLNKQPVPPLAYLTRDDLESALMQGTIVADFGAQGRKTFNVHRNNNIAYDRAKPPYTQERFWYFKQVDGVKGYGKDAEHKITVNPEVTFAADLTQFGLGRLLMVQYQASGKTISRVGVMADTGGAFSDNLYQVDYLVGSYPGKVAYQNAIRHLPDYVDAYFMVLKQ